jgi:hypothetical protein
MYVWRNIEARSRNHCCNGKAISITYCVCVCSLSYPACKAMRRITLPSVACLAIPHSFKLSHKLHDFRGENILNIKWVFWFSLQLLSVAFLILKRIQRHIIINVHRSSRKVPVILVRFQSILNFLDRFSKNAQISNFIKICPLGGELLHANRQTDEQIWRS